MLQYNDWFVFLTKYSNISIFCITFQRFSISAVTAVLLHLPLIWGVSLDSTQTLFQKTFFLLNNSEKLFGSWPNFSRQKHFCSAQIMATINFLPGEAINKYYFPVLVPVGLIGNILSFLVRLNKLCKLNCLYNLGIDYIKNTFRTPFFNIIKQLTDENLYQIACITFSDFLHK